MAFVCSVPLVNVSGFGFVIGDDSECQNVNKKPSLPHPKKIIKKNKNIMNKEVYRSRLQTGYYTHLTLTDTFPMSVCGKVTWSLM